MKLLIASNNQGKIREIKQLLSDRFSEIVSLRDEGIDIDVVEDGETFLDNAKKKAVEICTVSGMAALADDSGLCVEALSGAPGVYSARYAGVHGDDQANNDLLLKNMEGAENRRCKFVSATVLCDPDGRIVSGLGEVRGLLLERRVGSNGFGYDPIFYSEELGKSFGEASAEEKNAISHRARSLADLISKM